MAAIIHADNGDGVRSVHVAVIEQSGDFGHDVCEIVRAGLNVMLDCRGEFAITALDGVALFGDRKRAELERRRGKNLAQPGELIGLAPVGMQRLRDACDDFLLRLAVGIERDEQGEVIKRSVYLDELVAVGAIHGDYARGSKTFIEQVVLQIRDIAAEDVPSAEVYPSRRGLGVFDNGGDVEFRQFDACGVPRGAVFE